MKQPRSSHPHDPIQPSQPRQPGLQAPPDYISKPATAPGPSSAGVRETPPPPSPGWRIPTDPPLV